MKKLILAIGILVIPVLAGAQDKYISSAKESLSRQNFDEAKESIDKAMASPETKEKPKALLAKAQVYGSLQDVDKYKADNPYRDAFHAIEKLIEVKPDYEKATVDALLEIFGYHYFNDGTMAYNSKKLPEANEYMKMVIKIHDMNRFAKLPESRQKKFDTLTAIAHLTLANTAYYQERYGDAIPMLTDAKNNLITRSASVYQCLIDAYNKQDKKADALATIQEGMKAYPDDVTLRRYELNYYISSGKDDEMIKKLEDEAVKEPKSGDIQFNLATTYLKMASGTDGKKPANADELYAKSEGAFQKAIAISPDNPVYNYNFGALYFNRATECNEQMNSITGTSDADQKKYDRLKAERDDFFGKAQPYFEKTSSEYGSQKDLSSSDRSTYKQSLKALMEIYSRLSKMDKFAEAKKKYESI